MNSEIARIVGSETPTFVFVRKDDDAHYFYWPTELTFPQGNKKNDLEPIRVKENFGISRYHYHGITVWIDPISDKAKPLVDFTWNFHTPSFLSNSDKIVRGFRIQNTNVTQGDPRFYFLWAKYHKFSLSRQQNNFDVTKEYKEFFVKEIGSPLQKISHLFDADYIRNFALELILIGTESKITQTYNDIIRTDPGSQLTIEAIIQYFDF